MAGSAAEKHVSISDLWRRRLSRQSGALSHPHASIVLPAIEPPRVSNSLLSLWRTRLVLEREVDQTLETLGDAMSSGFADVIQGT